MEKTDALRAALASALPTLSQSPENFWVTVTDGRIRSTASAARGFEYDYTAELTFVETTIHPSLLFVIITDWLRTNQPDVLQPGQGFKFEAERDDSERVTIVVKLKLTEIVTVTLRPDGGMDLQHLDEPDYTAALGLTPLSGTTPAPLKSVWVDGQQVWGATP